MAPNARFITVFFYSYYRATFQRKRSVVFQNKFRKLFLNSWVIWDINETILWTLLKLEIRECFEFYPWTQVTPNYDNV